MMTAILLLEAAIAILLVIVAAVAVATSLSRHRRRPAIPAAERLVFSRAIKPL